MPAPASTTSLPPAVAPISMVSLPALPRMESAPAPPVKVSAPEPPTIVEDKPVPMVVVKPTPPELSVATSDLTPVIEGNVILPSPLTVKDVIVAPVLSPIVSAKGVLAAPVAVMVAASISCEPSLCTLTMPATPASVSNAVSAAPVSDVSTNWKSTLLVAGTLVALIAIEGPAIFVKLETTAGAAPVTFEIATLVRPVTLESVMATSPVTSIFSTLVQRTGVMAVAVPGVPFTKLTVSTPAPPSSASLVVNVVAVPLLYVPKNESGPVPPVKLSVLAVSGSVSWRPNKL